MRLAAACRLYEARLSRPRPAAVPARAAADEYTLINLMLLFKLHLNLMF